MPVVYLFPISEESRELMDKTHNQRIFLALCIGKISKML